MIQNTPEKEKIDTDAKAILKGMGLQEARIINRLLQAVLEGRENVFFAMEYIDDISEMDFNGKRLITQQNKIRNMELIFLLTVKKSKSL